MTKRHAMLGKGLLQRNANMLGGFNQLGARYLQQPAVRGVTDGLFLYGRVYDHMAEFLQLAKLQIHHQVDRQG